MIILKNNIEEVRYRYVTVEFSNKNSMIVQDEMKSFLEKVIKSYYSIESVLNKEELFDLLAYNYSTNKLHFLVHATNSQEIEEFVEYIRSHYDLWFGSHMEFVICKSKFVEKDMIVSASAHIHTLEKEWELGVCSSLRSYLYDDTPVWLASHHIKKLYGNAVDYYEYLKMYKNKEILVSLKTPLSIRLKS